MEPSAHLTARCWRQSQGYLDNHCLGCLERPSEAVFKGDLDVAVGVQRTTRKFLRTVGLTLADFCALRSFAFRQEPRRVPAYTRITSQMCVSERNGRCSKFLPSPWLPRFLFFSSAAGIASLRRQCLFCLPGRSPGAECRGCFPQLSARGNNLQEFSRDLFFCSASR